jgi:hypothetical protein
MMAYSNDMTTLWLTDDFVMFPWQKNKISIITWQDEINLFKVIIIKAFDKIILIWYRYNVIMKVSQHDNVSKLSR